MLRGAFKKIGADGAVAFTILNRLVVMASALITLSLVVVYMPSDLQGYYFTFASLVALQSLLELGMGIVLVQFVSHEWNALHIRDETLMGDARAMERVCSLVRLGLRWYAITAVAFALVIGLLGSLLLVHHDDDVQVLVPWWLLCIAASGSLLLVPLRSMLEGSNQVARVQKFAMIAFVAGTAAGSAAIVLGFGLYSLFVATLTSALLGLILYGRASQPFLRAARKVSATPSLSWLHEFWPQQWRIALSVFSGFCAFQSFVPISFYFLGPVVAGQMGASLQVFNAVHTVGQAWGNARGPRFGILGARRQVDELRDLVRDTTVRGTWTAALCSVAALGGVAVLEWTGFKADRFIGLFPLAVLLCTSIVLQKTAVETLAIRFQKTEPFLLAGLASAGLMVVSNAVGSRYFGTAGISLGFAAVMIGMLAPWVHHVYVRQMNRFSSEAIRSAGQ